VPILVKNGLQAFNINGYRVLNLGEFLASFWRVFSEFLAK
jgi:hypothetical protein